MDAIKFIEERNRMCESFGNRCTGCPASNACNDNPCCCAVAQESTMDATDQIAIVEKWSAAHPRKTRQSEFLKHYPKADVLSNGVISLCPKLIEGYNPSAGCCDTDCYDCKTEYWMQEVE